MSLRNTAALCCSVSALAVATLVAVGAKSPNDDILTSNNRAQSTSPATQPATPNLVERAYEKGLHFFHSQQSKGIAGLDESLGSGVCVVDIDRDHDLDVVAVGGNGHNRFYGRQSWWAEKTETALYVNDGQGNFDNDSRRLGLGSIWGMGCAASDLNLDGWQDIVISTRNSIELLINQQGQDFQRRQLWQGEDNWPTSISVADIDNNGLPDIYVAGYLLYHKTAKHFEGSGGYSQGLHVQFKPQFYNGRPNLLFVNQGSLQFKEEAQTKNIANAEGRTLSSQWLDVNDDQYPDLLIVNDSGSATQLYINQEGKTFEKAQGKHRLDIPSHTRSAAADDYDNDGDLDIVLTTALGEPPVILVDKGATFSNDAWQLLADPVEALNYSSFGATSADLNNDGILDIYFASGFDTPDADTYYQPQGQANVLAIGSGAGKYRLVKQRQGSSLSSRTATAADIDNDGDDDLLVSNNNGPLQLYVNESPLRQWVGVDAGEKLIKAVLTTDKRKLTRFSRKTAFLGNQDHRVRFALAESEAIVDLQLYLDDGKTLRVEKPELGKYLNLDADVAVSHYPSSQNVPNKRKDFHLVKWSLVANKADPLDVRLFQDLPAEQKIEWINMIVRYHAEPHLAVLQRALEDTNTKVIESAIEALKILEREDTAHWLMNLFHSEKNFDRCLLSETFRHLFIEEEALTHRKNLAIPLLVKQLSSKDSKVKICTLAALSESKSPRPVLPVKKILSSDTGGKDVKEMAAYTLGELRRATGFSKLQVDSEYPNEVYKKYVIARQKAEGKLTPASMTQAGKQADNLFGPNKQTVQTRITQISACISISNTALLSARKQQIAHLFNRCSTREVRHWAEYHSEWLFENYRVFLDTEHLSPALLEEILTVLSRKPPQGIVDVLRSRLINKTTSAHKIAILKAIPVLGTHKFVDILKDFVASPTESRQVRIAAGDLVVGIHGDFVMRYGEELFP